MSLPAWCAPRWPALPAALAIFVWLALPCAARAAAPRGAESAPGQAAVARAQAALAAGDYAAAYAAYVRAAPRSPLAQFMAGVFHQQGWGRARDPAAACAWFEKAAARGVPAAAHFWGDCLAQGTGRPADSPADSRADSPADSPADIPRALAAYRSAAEGGHLISWCAAADYLIAGRGVPKDAALGLALCAQAAQAHSAPAMLKLGGYHQSGRDVPQDLAAARSWYAEAARHGAPEGQYRLGLMLAQGEGGPPDLDAALHWLESAAAAGFAPAYLPTAQLYASLPVQANSGALAPEHLAKIYLWTSAAKAAAADAQQRVAAGQLEAQVLTAMPVSWRPALDRRVTEHLAKSSPGAASAVVVNR